MRSQVKEYLQRKREGNGFTLMELLIVIAIIAVLVAIAIPVFAGQLDTAKDAADKANARALYALAQAEWMDDADHTVASNFSPLNGDNKVIVTFENGNTQAFTFSDRTTDVNVEFFDDFGAHVVVASLANDGAGFEYPEG